MTETAPSPTSVGGWFYSLWKFSRPHTIIGTSLSVLGLYGAALALAQASPKSGFEFANLMTLGFAWLACISGNLYIVGLNQLEDVEIDRINKPHLPLAAGEFTQFQGWGIVATAGCLALLLAIWQGQYLLATVGLSLLIGSAYSLPPIRLKRFPVWAALCILGVRGVIVNLGLFLHFQDHLKQEHSGPFHFSRPNFSQNDFITQTLHIPPAVWALTAFVVVFSFAIAVFKDIPDAEGDRQYQISTLTLRLGSRSVFNLALGVLTTCYLGMIMASFIWLSGWQTPTLFASQLIALGVLWGYGLRVDLNKKAEIADFYQLIWKLFFWQYLIFPVACWLP
jgi:homogentisate phytyltransferase/homogentisate geranylgeranyltransferase